AAIVSGVTLTAASSKLSFNNQIDRSFGGDLTVTTGSFGFGGISPKLTDDINQLPEVEGATGARFGALELDGVGKGVFVIDDQLPKVLDLGVEAGGTAITDLGIDGLAVTKKV